MLKRFKYIPLLTLLLLSSCQNNDSKGVPPGKTVLKLKSFFGTTNSTGGRFIYGVSPSETIAVNVSASTDVILANGGWTFYALSWDGATSLSGNLKCAKTTSTLDGGDLSISLNLSVDCSDEEFGNSRYRSGTSFLPLKFYSCSGGADFSSSFDCSSQQGAVLSARVTLVGTSSNLASPCISYGGSYSKISTITVPSAGATVKMPVKVEFFSDASCSNSALSNTATNGLEDYYGSSGSFSLGVEGSNMILATRLSETLNLIVRPPVNVSGAKLNNTGSSRFLEISVGSLYELSVLKNPSTSRELRFRLE